MKSLTKKALSLATAIALAGSFAVCAASITITEADVGIVKTEEGTDTTSIQVPFTATDLDDAAQVTILVYNTDDAADPTVTDAIDNFAFIDQRNLSDGTTVTFPMRDKYVVDGKIKDGNYKILMGCSGMTSEAATFTLVVEGEEAILYGDVTGEGEITAVDAGWVLRKSVNPDLALSVEAAADVTGEGEITAVDAGWILRKSVNPDLVFPRLSSAE